MLTTALPRPESENGDQNYTLLQAFISIVEINYQCLVNFQIVHCLGKLLFSGFVHVYAANVAAAASNASAILVIV
jgi:hypothetical protein